MDISLEHEQMVHVETWIDLLLEHKQKVAQVFNISSLILI